MKLSSQISETFFKSPFSIFRLGPKARKSLLVYFILTLALLGLSSLLIVTYQEEIKKALLSYIFPNSWHNISEFLFQFFFESQSKMVLGNAIVSTALILVSALLFPFKERVSANFESENRLCNDEVKELPLWMQGLEEVKLVILFLTIQMSIFWLGYYPNAFNKMLASSLSVIVVFCSFTFDFLSPLLQRHKKTYSTIAKLYAKKPLLALGFGALHSAPVILISNYVMRQADMSLVNMIAVIFLSSIVFLILGVVNGTYLASKLLDDANEIIPPKLKSRALGSLIILLLFSLNSWVYYHIIYSIHHKSPMFKCNYTIVDDSFDFSVNNVAQIFGGKVDGTVAFDLQIENTTSTQLILEENLLLLKHKEKQVAQMMMTPFSIDGNKTEIRHFELDATIQIDEIGGIAKKSFLSLLDIGNDPINKAKEEILGWSVVLYFDLGFGIKFPLYLL